MQNCVPTFNKCIASSLKRIKFEAGKGEFDVQKYMSDAVMNAVLGETVEGVNFRMIH